MHLLGHCEAMCPLSKHLKHWIEELDLLVFELDVGVEVFTFEEVCWLNFFSSALVKLPTLVLAFEPPQLWKFWPLWVQSP